MMKLRKIVAGITAFLLMTGSVTFDVFHFSNNAQTIQASAEAGDPDECGQGAVYSFDEVSGALKIGLKAGASEGMIGESFFSSDGGCTFCEKIKSVYISAGITEIKTKAFISCNNLESITFDNDSKLASIGKQAFRNCKSLNNVVLPDSVNSIGNYAFAQCSSLTGIIIPNSVLIINDSAFYSCEKLESITIPASVTSISSYAFNNCTSLQSVTFAKDSKLTQIGSSAFNNCPKIKSISFSECSLLTDIGISAFRDCTSLESVTFAESSSLNIIKYSAFRNCKQLTGSLFIPDSVTTIEDYAFSECTGITDVIIAKGSKLTSIGEQAFNKCLQLKSVQFSENSELTSIGSSAFSECTGLTSITIPDSVTTIGNSAFYKCSQLKSLQFAENSKLTSIGSSAFSECTGLTSVTIPDSVTTIENSAFINCSNLITVKFSKDSQLTGFSGFTFANCSSLTEITIPDYVSTIGFGEFFNCPITSLTAPCNLQNDEAKLISGCDAKVIYTHPIKKGNMKCACGKEVDIKNADDQESLTKCGDNAYYTLIDGKLTITGTGEIRSTDFQQDKIFFTSVKIEKGITSIGEKTFYGNSRIVSATIPETVTYIGDDAFKGCTNLKSVNYVGTEADWNKMTIGHDDLSGVNVNCNYRYVKGAYLILDGALNVKIFFNHDIKKEDGWTINGKEVETADKAVFFTSAAKDFSGKILIKHENEEKASFSIADMIETYKNVQTYGQSTADLVTALEEYCAAASAYFDNNGTVSDHRDSWDTVKNAIGRHENVSMGDNYYGSSLILKSRTILRHYYTSKPNTENYGIKGSFYYTNEAISAMDYNNTGTANDKYCVNDYIYKVLSSNETSDDLKNMCVTLYYYGQTALIYMNNATD